MFLALNRWCHGGHVGKFLISFHETLDLFDLYKTVGVFGTDNCRIVFVMIVNLIKGCVKKVTMFRISDCASSPLPSFLSLHWSIKKWFIMYWELGKKVETFCNKISSTSWKWSILNAHSSETPVCYPLLKSELIPFSALAPSFSLSLSLWGNNKWFMMGSWAG